jgi:hypothetical protein
MRDHRKRPWRPLKERPRWDKGKGLWYALSLVSSDRATSMYRWRPKVDSICEPLLGTAVPFCVRKGGQDANGNYKNEFSMHEVQRRDPEHYYSGSVVHYPRIRRRLKLYREGLELVVVFGEREDLFKLATYRREVTIHDISADSLFIEVAERLSPALTSTEWHLLATRMPKNTWVHNECERRAHALKRMSLAV